MTTELIAQKAYLTVALGPNKKPVDSSRLLAPNPALFLCQEWSEYYIIDSLQVAHVWDHMLTTKLRQGDIVCRESAEHYIGYYTPYKLAMYVTVLAIVSSPSHCYFFGGGGWGVGVVEG